MSEQLYDVRAKLRAARQKHGEMAKIALASGVTYRTLYNLLNTTKSPNVATLDKLSAYFKKQARKAAQ